ncbi:MAG: class I SAM-dependent methyltransferase [archaeon]
MKNLSRAYNKDYFKALYGNIPFYEFYLQRKNVLVAKIIENYAKKGRLLDIGCGNGNILSYFSKKFKVFGLDISSYILKKAKEAVPSAKVKVCDIEKKDIPFKKKFDVIFLWNIIEHMKNPGKVLKRIGKNLGKNSIVVIHLPTINNLISALEYKVVWDWLIKEKTHIYRPSIKEFRKLLENSGYEILEEFSGQLLPLALTKNRLVMQCACQYMVIARKK